MNYINVMLISYACGQIVHPCFIIYVDSIEFKINDGFLILEGTSWNLTGASYTNMILQDTQSIPKQNDVYGTSNYR